MQNSDLTTGLLSNFAAEENSSVQVPAGLSPSAAPAGLVSFADQLRASSPSQGPPADPLKGVELEDLHISVGKRIYAQIDMIIMAFNTINAVFSISAQVSLISEDAYSHFFRICDYNDGTPLNVLVQCPYYPSPVFISFIITWTLYFVTIFIYRYQRTIEYWSNDLRFYLACDMLNNEMFMYIMVFVGVLLTFVSAIGGIYYATHNGSDTTIGSVMVFTGVNLLNLKGMLGGRFKALKKEIHLNKIFPSPIFFKIPTAGLANGHGVTISHRDIFETLLSASNLSLQSGSDSVLQRIGNADQIRAVVSMIFPDIHDN